MSPGVASKLIAAISGLSAFTIALVTGLAAGNSAAVILSRALLSMVLCNVVGLLLGSLGERTVAEAVASYKKSHPVPDDRAPATTSRSGAGAVVGV